MGAHLADRDRPRGIGLSAMYGAGSSTIRRIRVAEVVQEGEVPRVAGAETVARSYLG